MKTTPNKLNILHFVSQLDSKTKKILLKELTKQFSILPDFDQTRKTILDNQKNTCPHCHSENIIGYGKNSQGRRRYKCNNCVKIFNELTGTSIDNIKKKNLFPRYLELMLENNSIRKISEELCISTKTSFNWRHKVLSSLKNLDKGKFRGILEIDDKPFEFSEKGRKNLTRKPYKRPTDRPNRVGNNNSKIVTILSTDRNNNMDFKVVQFGRLKTRVLNKFLKNKMEKNTILCSDSHNTYKRWCRENEVQHEYYTFNKGQHMKTKVYHTQHINSLDNRLGRFLEKFYGVSTKYLQNYLNWFVMIESIKKSNDKMDEFMNVVLKSNQSWMEFDGIEENYQEFILKTKPIME